MAAPQLENHCGSWIVMCLTTGEALFETFDRGVADKASEHNYLVVFTAAEWLSRLND